MRPTSSRSIFGPVFGSGPMTSGGYSMTAAGRRAIGSFTTFHRWKNVDGSGRQPYLYLTPWPPPGHSQVMLSQGQSMRQAPHSMQFS